MPVPQITALPDPPSRQDPTNFAVKGDAFLGGLPTFATEANALATQVNERVDAAFAAGLESAATNAATTVTKAAEARASELAAAGYANEAMLLSLGVETLRPSIKPSLLLDFARAQVVPPSVTFTRASTAMRVGPSGLIETVGINVPRIDYDPVTRACLGLLVEEQRTNLLLQSSNFENASWLKLRLAVTADAAISPDGTMTADKVIPDTQSNEHFIYQNAPSGSHAVTLFAKAAGYNFVRFNDTGANIAIFDLSAGIFTFQGGVVAGTARAVALPNGWYKISFVRSFANGQVRFFPSPDGNGGFTGDGTSGVLFWGAQLEAGSFPTSYIPTTTASVTRARDDAVVSQVSPWYRADEGTLYLEGAHFSGASANSGIDLRSDAPNKFSFRNGLLVVNTSSASEANITYLGDNGIVSKKAFAFKQNDISVARNGSIVGSDTSINLPPVSELRFSIDNTSFSYNGHIRQIKYFPQRLANTQLQALTNL